MDLYKAKYSDKKFDRHSKSSQTSRRNFQENEPSRSYRNSRSERKPEMHIVTCDDCGDECKIPFEPKFNRPIYCSECFKKNKPKESGDRYSRDDRYSRNRYSRDDRSSSDRNSRSERKPEMHIVTCDDCGDECKIPFEPKFNRPIYCSECFQKNKPKESGDRYSRDDRSFREKNSRYERDTRSSSEDFRTNKSKSKKFLKKTGSFYSNGSEKFYSSLKEKLFEILGGKTCSSCGFKDERALGFNHISDEDAFDSIRRGGFASSWGKYISEPELARRELRVLCLNCNEIREPQTKTESKKSETMNKQSRYFPR